MNIKHQITWKVISLLMLFTQSIISYAQEDSFSLGKTEKFYSESLGKEISLNVHLPESYNSNIHNYPVLYLLNGQDLPTYANAASALDFLSFEMIPEFILVGIVSSAELFEKIRICPSDSIKQKELEEFVNKLFLDITTYIDSKYRTEPYNLLYGQSNLGLLALHALFINSRCIKSYIIGSPPFGWCQTYLFNRFKSSLNNNLFEVKNLFVSYGEFDYPELVISQIQSFEDLLMNYPSEWLNYKVFYAAGEGHVPVTTLNYGLLNLFSDTAAQ